MAENASIRFSTKTLLIAFFFVSYILAAYSRGAYLLDAGALYAFVAMLVTLLFVRALSKTPTPRWRFALLTVIAIPVSLAFAFPMYLNPGLQYFIEKEATDRVARAELATLLVDDPAFQELTVSTTQRKILCVEIDGAMPTREDLLRVRSRATTECESLRHCHVRWNVYVDDEQKVYTASGDGELAVSAEED